MHSSTPHWRFGPFLLDPQEYALWRGEQVVPVTRKALVLLATLLGRPGKLFTKAELFDTVWAGSVVTDAALSRAIHELRVALGDDAGAPRFIATAHGLGFRFVAPVTGGAPAATAAVLATASKQLLVGRQGELACLDVALVRAQAGQRQILMVTGEAGIGKSTLVQAFVDRHAGADGPWIAQGRCIEQYGTAEAYLPILEALEQLAPQVGHPALLGLLLRYAPAWLALLPWLAQDADPAALARAQVDITAQRMLREIAQALEVLAAQRAIVLWLEDLHWSDPSSLAVLSFLAGRRDPARLMLVASFRPVDAPAGDSPLKGLALRLAQRGQASEIVLGMLDRAAVAQYLNGRLGCDARLAVDELAAFVHRRTDGNPLFTVAVVDDLVARGRLRQAQGAWALDGPVATLGQGLPDTLRHLVNGQAERLSERDRRLVEAAAVAGPDFSAAAVAAALQADTEDTEERCARLAEQGRFLRARTAVAWPDGTVAAGFGFLHAVYWQGLYDRVPLGRRAEWQRRIGLRQEQAYGAQCASVAAELAMRFEVARDTERSLRYLQVAGAAALARCAYPECIELLRHGLTLVPELPPELRARHELDLLLPLGAALMAAQGYASNDVEVTYQRALVLSTACARPGDVERVTRGLWNVLFLRADLARARELPDELLRLALVARDASLVFDAHTKLGQTCLHLADLPGARRHLEQALDLPTPADEATRARALPRVGVYLAWTLWYTGFPSQALARADDAIRWSQQADSPHSTVFALGYASWIHFLCGDLGRALALACQQAMMSAEHGLPYWRLLAEFTKGRAAVRQGDYLGGMVSMRRAIDAMRAGGGRVGIPYLLCLLAEAELMAGQPAAARATLAAASLMARNGNALYAAEALRLEGEVNLVEDAGPAGRLQAAQRFAAALALARQQGARALELRAATSLARLWGNDGQALRATELLAPILHGFDEGHETEDLVHANRLIQVLSC